MKLKKTITQKGSKEKKSYLNEKKVRTTQVKPLNLSQGLEIGLTLYREKQRKP